MTKLKGLAKSKYMNVIEIAPKIAEKLKREDLPKGEWRKIIAGMSRKELRNNSAEQIARKYIKKAPTIDEFADTIEEQKKKLDRGELELSKETARFVRLMEVAELEKAKKVTEFGCGSGTHYGLVRVLLDWGGVYHGIDMDRAALNRFEASQLFFNCRLHQVNLSEQDVMPKETANSDIVLCHQLIHLSTNQAFLSCIFAYAKLILNRGGYLVLEATVSDPFLHALELESAKTKRKLNEKRFLNIENGIAVTIGVRSGKQNKKEGKARMSGASYHTKEAIDLALAIHNFKIVHQEPHKLKSKHEVKRIFNILGSKPPKGALDALQGDVMRWYIVAKKQGLFGF